MSQDFFTLLNIKLAFDLDLNELDRNYFKLQKQFHPDQYIHINPNQRIEELEYSALINKAYNTLKFPLTRAAYLLNLQGLDTSENIAPINDPEFLEKSMEDRESLQEIDSLIGLKKFETEILVRQSNILKDFSKYYQNNLIREATESYIQLKYISRVLEEISNKRRLINYAAI